MILPTVKQWTGYRWMETALRPVVYRAEVRAYDGDPFSTRGKTVFMTRGLSAWSSDVAHVVCEKLNRVTFNSPGPTFWVTVL